MFQIFSEKLWATESVSVPLILLPTGGLTDTSYLKRKKCLS